VKDQRTDGRYEDIRRGLGEERTAEQRRGEEERTFVTYKYNVDSIAFNASP
jgi:hypothetical protein